MGAGISLLDPQTQQVRPFTPVASEPNNLGDPNIMTIFVDRAGRTWIGSAERGIDILDASDQHLLYCRYTPLDSFSISDDAIRTIFQDSEGQIWIGTERGGLNRWLGKGRFERITKEEGLISNSVMGITEDQNGALWISSFEGISKLDKETATIQNFDFRTLQNSNQFNQEAILSTLNGKLLFGGIYGLNAIRPDKVISSDQQPEIIFTDLKIYNKSIPVGELPDGRVILEKPIENSSQIWLNYSDQSFSIDFTAADYTNPLENVFAYKMEGFNKDWQFTSDGQRSVTYTNLDPGAYTFKVKHKDKLASIIINIKPPYWQTIWFRSLVITSALSIFLSGLYFWIKRREAAHKRKILKLQNEKLLIEVEAQNSKLMFSSVQMAHKNEILTEVKKDLNDLDITPQRSAQSLIRKLDHELKNEDYWNEFNLYFNQVDKKFIDKLIKEHPDLTKNDIRMSSLLRLNLSTKEIASLLNISPRAVEQGRYRLKKRLQLDKEEDLLRYISSF
jgi:DNA-binding CsgD family transcriptional regulator